MRIASDARTSPIWRRPFITSVEPVETRSTIASARPSRGATSTAPEIGMISTGMPRSVEEPAGGVRVGRRDAQAGEVLDAPVRRVVGDRGREPAPAVAERADPRQLGAGLGEEVDAGDAEVGDAVADELDDVVRPDEQDVEVVVLDAARRGSGRAPRRRGPRRGAARSVGSTSRPLLGTASRRRAPHRSPATG